MPEAQGIGRACALALKVIPKGDSGEMADSGEQVASAARSPAGLKVLTLHELLDHSETPKRALLGSWLRTGEGCLLYGPTGCGKSLLALSVALAVAGAGRLLGWQGGTPEGRGEGEGYRALFADGEMAVGDLRDRATLLMEALPGIDRPLALDGVRFLSRLAQDNGGDFISITSDEGCSALLDIVDMGKFDLVVFDNLSTLGDVEDENSAGAFNPLLRTLLALKQRNVAVLLVHHATKDGKAYRGSSKIPAVMDVVLGLRVPDNKLVGEARFSLAWEKSRARGKDLLPLTVLLSSGVGSSKTQWIIEGINGRLVQLKAMIETGMYSTKVELAVALGVDPKTIYNYLAEGVKLGLWYADWDKDCFKAMKAGKPLPRADGNKANKAKMARQEGVF